MADPVRLDRVLRRSFPALLKERPPCAHCGHSSAQHNTPGSECIAIVGADALGAVYCACLDYEAPCSL